MDECKRWQARMVAALRGELRKAERATLKRHISACEACRQHWEELRHAWDALDLLDASEAGNQAGRHDAARADQTHPSSPPRRKRRRPR